MDTNSHKGELFWVSSKPHLVSAASRLSYSGKSIYMLCMTGMSFKGLEHFCCCSKEGALCGFLCSVIKLQLAPVNYLLDQSTENFPDTLTLDFST